MRKGFTLIELMIVIAIIAIIAAIAIPNLLESRITANESAASTSLKSAIFAGQVQYSAGGYCDLDTDNRGEYGHLSHLSGELPSAGTDLAVAPPTDGVAAGSLTLIGAEFATGAPAALASGAVGLSTQASTTTPISGYNFASILPLSNIDGTAAANTQAQIDTGEKYYAVTAAPDVYDDTGRRCFAITQEGKVLTAAPSPTVGTVDLTAAATTIPVALAAVATAAFTNDGATLNTGTANDSSAADVPACASPDNRTPAWATMAR